MNPIYLDSNVLIAYYSRSKTEEEKKKIVLGALATFAKVPEVKLFTSAWAIAETINILISAMGMDQKEVAEIESQLTNERRMAGLKIEILDVSPIKDYDFKEFFYNVRQGILKYHSGVGDIIHSVIMKNYKISTILTFDEKDDFTKIPDLTVLHPRVVKIEKK